MDDHTALNKIYMGTVQEYNGFNLVVGDLSTGDVAYLTNREDDGIVRLVPGTYGISNAALNCAWPKVFTGKDALQVRLGLENASLCSHAAFCVHTWQADIFFKLPPAMSTLQPSDSCFCSCIAGGLFSLLAKLNIEKAMLHWLLSLSL